MKSLYAVKVAIVAVVCLLLSACAVAPVQEMSDARQALAAAEAAGAQRYSQTQFQRAQQLLREAETRLGRGAYSDAKRFALDARFEAIRAREAAVDEQNAYNGRATQ